MQARKQNKKNIVYTLQKYHLASEKPCRLTCWQENRPLYQYAWTRITWVIPADLAFICACLGWIYLNANWFAANPSEQIEILWNRPIHQTTHPSIQSPIYPCHLSRPGKWRQSRPLSVKGWGEAGRCHGLGIRSRDVAGWLQLRTQVVIKSLVIG